MPVKVQFGLDEGRINASVTGLQEELGKAQGDLEYVNRKLWVRVDELNGGRSEADVLGTLSKDSAAVKIPKFLETGEKAVDQATIEVSNLAAGMKAVQKEMIAWKIRYTDVVLHGKKASGGLDKWIIKMAQDLEDIRGRIYDAQGQ